MSQFRIKNIDHALPDEWVYKLNDGVSIVGDDIDARDPNELADAILDTQTVILKTSTLPAGAILKANSGLAERITILEAIAGNSTLQDIYANGNTISILAGKPLIFGIREEFKLDDSGNLSFKPATMKVKGVGFSTLDFTNMSVTTNLGDLLVGATSPGSKLTLRAENYLYLKDVFLTNPVTLSEPGNTSLSTTSQSLVGAVNELKASSFNTSLQAVYSQSSPPKLTTNIAQGAVVIEDPNPLSAADALKVIGNFNATKRVKTAEVRVGSNTIMKDTTGFVTSDPIVTSNKVETPYITSGTNDLILQDKRVSFPLTDPSVTDLATTKKSIIGAINEVRADIQTVGASTTLFNVQHDSVNGFHKIITTQAEIGNNATKRFTVKNQSGVETLSINGFGDLISNSAVVGGLNVVNLLTQLAAHIVDDGTSHSALAAHLTDANPHNTVKNILGLSGNVSVASSDGSISVSTSGNTVNLQVNNNTNLQQTYDNLSTKQLVLNSTGLSFRDSTSALIMILRNLNIGINKDLLFESSNPLIGATDLLTVNPNGILNLNSTTNNIDIKTIDSSKKVVIQNVDFNEAGATTLSSTLGTSVLGAFKKISNSQEIQLAYPGKATLDYVVPHFVDAAERAWPYIANLHPANEFMPLTKVDFFWQNSGALYFPKGNILAGTTGTYYTSGTHNVIASSNISLPANFVKGAKLYPQVLSHADITITDAMAIAHDNQILFNLEVPLIAKVATTPAPDFSLGHFKVDQSILIPAELRTDNTRDNIIGTINDYTFFSNPLTSVSLKAGIWGEAAHTWVSVIATVTNETFIITPNANLGAVAVTLIAAANPTGWNEFQASGDLSVVAHSLAEAINRTTFKSTSASSINGHKCRAVAVGTAVKIQWYKPGLSSRLITFSGSASGTFKMTVGTMTGGSSMLRIYDVDIANTELHEISFTGSAGVTVPAIFTARERSPEFFLTRDEAFASARYAPHYQARELGTVEGKSGNLIVFKIKD